MTDGTLSPRQCPICRAEGPKFEFAARSPWRQAREPYPVMHCLTCEHRWCVGDVSPGLLAAIYGEGFHQTAQQEAGQGGAVDEMAPVYINAARRAAWLKTIVCGVELLDIGAGSGFFVLAAARTGFTAQGVDLSGLAVERAAAIGAQVRQGDFLGEQGESAAFDAVTLWDSLCGMVDPHLCMRRVAEALREDGVCAMTVAAGSSRVARLAGRYWPLMIPPVNVHFFSRESMGRLLAAHGLTLVGWHAEGKRVSTRFVLQKLVRTLRLNALEPAIRGLVPARWSFRLDLGDIVTVVARPAGGPA